jgi:flagellar biosynthetic protein FliP
MSIPSWIRNLGLLLLVLVIFTPSAEAQQLEAALERLFETSNGLGIGEALPAGGAADVSEENRLSSAVEIAVLLTALSLLPAILISITSFTRIVIVLSFVRRALSINELPPNPVLVGLALFLTSFVMAPVAERVYDKAWDPYQQGEMEVAEATKVAWSELQTFLVTNTRETELQLFAEMSGYEKPSDVENLADTTLPVTVVIPAFVLSELKTAFQMGFLLFLPFLVIDLVVSSILLSMGMFMLPPVMISTPFKILVFVLVDGWHLICQSVVTSFTV